MLVTGPMGVVTGPHLWHGDLSLWKDLQSLGLPGCQTPGLPPFLGAADPGDPPPRATSKIPSAIQGHSAPPT